jgi:hypothetical protein
MKNKAEKEAKLIVIRHLKSTGALVDDAVLLNEFTANFSGFRADLVCLDPNGLHAIEIKSSSDSFYRAQFQVDVYAHYFSMTTFAVAEKHLENAKSKLPNWTGIWLISESGVKVIRTARPRTIRKCRLIDMLLVYDLSNLLNFNGISTAGLVRKQLVEAAMKLSHGELYIHVLNCIRNRYDKQSRFFFQNFGDRSEPKIINLLSPSYSKKLRITAAKNSRSEIWDQWTRLSATA